MVNLTTLRIMKPSSPDGTSSISVNGSGNFQTQYNLDGVTDTTNDRGRGYARVAFIPPSTAVTEFKMQSNPYDASVGHTLGPVINVGTKSGANALHGAVYYWGRNSAFDSANFFDNKAGLKKAVYQDHRYGASAGGPVFIPQGLRRAQQDLLVLRLGGEPFRPALHLEPDQHRADRRGAHRRFLRRCWPSDASYQIYNPFSTRASSTAGRFQRDPFPGNIIPKSLLSAPGLDARQRSIRCPASRPAPSTAATTTTSPTCASSATIRTWRASTRRSRPTTACSCA